MTGGNRTPWPSGALRRQKSCGDGFLLATTVRGGSRSERYTHTLQRQFSVDQDMRHCQSTIKDDKLSPETNFRTHAKKRQPTNGEGVSKSEQQQQPAPNNDLSERLKKALNRRDNRINLNIVLTQVPNIPEPEALNVSDSESNEVPQAPVESDAPREVPDVLPEETKGVLKSNVGKPASARGQRPPLVRAMSAPIRTTAADASQSRRKNLRRRKFGREREENLILSSRKNLERQDAVASDTSPVRQTKVCDRKGQSVATGAARSSIGCDIVTLVSLLSSGGSDSEREDNGQQSTGRPEKNTTRPPSLKKTGKSVSFQDNDTVPFSAPPKDFSAMFRRGSVAPLAARIRSNRPPTAPPGSIFITDYDKGCGEESMSFKKQPVARGNFVKAQSKNEDKCGTIEADVDSPDNLKTAKERECWKLFQKMTNRGISVSYDTILRGMLTPTELRMIQKKQELENAKRNSTEEPPASAKAGSPASAQNRDKVKNAAKQ